MIKNLNEQVTYHTLNNSDYFKIATDKNLAVALSLAVTSLAVLALAAYIVYKIYDKIRVNKFMKILSLPIFIILAAILVIINTNIVKFVTIESNLLITKPYYRDVNITGKIDDISNGSSKYYQEIRFSKNGENYYVTIPSEVVARSNDEINVKIDKQIVSKYSMNNNLNDDLIHDNDKVLITHDNKTYRTHLTSR